MASGSSTLTSGDVGPESGRASTSVPSAAIPGRIFVDPGVLADAVVLLESTGLGLLHGGVGVLWVEIEIDGVPAHAESADRAVNPVGRVPVILQALAGLEEQINAEAPYVTGVFLWNLNFRTVVPETDEKFGFGLLNPDLSPTPGYACAADFVSRCARLSADV